MDELGPFYHFRYITCRKLEPLRPYAQVPYCLPFYTMHLQQNKLYSFLTGMLPKLRITFYYFYGFTMNIYAFDVSELKKKAC